MRSLSPLFDQLKRRAIVFFEFEGKIEMSFCSQLFVIVVEVKSEQTFPKIKMLKQATKQRNTYVYILRDRQRRKRSKTIERESERENEIEKH